MTDELPDYGVGPNADEEESDAVNEDAMGVVEGDAESVDAVVSRWSEPRGGRARVGKPVIVPTGADARATSSRSAG